MNHAARLLLSGACMIFCAGCSLFSNSAPLPKHASIEHAGAPAAATDYRALVEQADVIYFPQERAASGAKSEPAALLVEAVQQSGKPFAVAWDLIDATQQTLLDQLPPEGAAREQAIRKLELSGTGRAREHCRAVLRAAGLHALALQLPGAVSEKIAAGAPLTVDEQRLLPTGYTLPVGGYQAYAESSANRSGLNDRALAASYRAEVIRREFAAETIVRYFRGAAPETKLIVFAKSADFGDDKGVPFYVAQKLNVRQLVLGREKSESRGSLLAFVVLRRSFEVVDRTPRSARD